MDHETVVKSHVQISSWVNIHLFPPIKYNLFSERKPFEKIENQIKGFKEKSLTPYRKRDKGENTKNDKRFSKFYKLKENE